MKKIAIIGRPNGGKSSLFNRLISKRKAITCSTSGTTRDVCHEICTIGGYDVYLSDTGGINKQEASHCLFGKVSAYSLQAARESDVILFVVDGKMDVFDDDIRLVREIQCLKKPIVLIINKLDNDKDEQRLWEYDVFGIHLLVPISVLHNRGIDKLIKTIETLLNDLDDESKSDGLGAQDFHVLPSCDTAHLMTGVLASQLPITPIRIAIIGRVNVGKSSLLNALLGQPRSIVSEIAGTTIDPVDMQCKWGQHDFYFVDTAGLRRKGKIEGIEKYALMRTEEMLQNADIALLVLDCSQPFVELDEKIGALALENNLGVILVLNKIDIKHQPLESLIKIVREKFKYLSYAPIISVSAQSGRKIDALKAKIVEVFDNLSRRIPTAVLNDVILQAAAKHPIPSDRGKIVRIYYTTQYKTHPPHIVLVMNRPSSLHFSYKRYLANVLRKHFCFDGVPLIIEARKKGQRHDTLP